MLRKRTSIAVARGSVALLAVALFSYALSHVDFAGAWGLFYVLVFEGGFQLVQAAAVAAPAGLGVSDFGCITILGTLGTPTAAAVSGALLLMKRSMELMWILAGYALLFSYTRRPDPLVLATA